VFRAFSVFLASAQTNDENFSSGKTLMVVLLHFKLKDNRQLEQTI
jgi:hypothetical protein